MSIAHIRILHSFILGEDRKIYIYKPDESPDYLPSSYPVLYLLDAENHMEMVVGQLAYLSKYNAILPPMIIVGITNNNRFKDLTTPIWNKSTDSQRFGKAGGADRFLQFIQQELIPYIDKNYHTIPYRVISGHSLGALTAVYSLFHYPDMFNAYIAISPSLGWDNEAGIKYVEHDWQPKFPMNKILFLSDGKEGGRFHRDVVSFDSLLNSRKYEGLSKMYQSYPNESHAAEPVKAFYDGINFIFPNWYPSTDTGFVTADLIKNHYKGLSEKYQCRIVPPEPYVNGLGYYYLSLPSRLNAALELFKMNASQYPSSFNVFIALGDGYLKVGDKKKAMVNFQRALKMNPADNRIIEKINKIGK